jgi:predicted DNA-binding transcriptional regulator YafY
MSKSERLIFILSVLRGNKFLRAKDLAQKCGVSERTIYRDIISISGINIPIYYENGYRLINQEFLPPINFTSSEAKFLTTLLMPRVKYHRKNAHRTAERILDKLVACRVPEQTTNAAW